MKNHLFITALAIGPVYLAACATTAEQDIVSFAPLNVAAGQEQIADDYTPLHNAARDGDTEAVKKLLRQGASVYAVTTASGVTPLILAATAGHEQIVEVLLDAGAAVNTADKTGGTALLYASAKGHDGIVHTLLQRGADVHVKSPKNYLDSTALTLAAGNGHDAVLDLLLKAGVEIDWRSEQDGLSALMLAAELGQGNSVSKLLSAGANPELRDRKGNTACALAAANGHGAVTMALDEFYLSQGQGKRCRSDNKRVDGVRAP